MPSQLPPVKPRFGTGHLDGMDSATGVVGPGSRVDDEPPIQATGRSTARMRAVNLGCTRDLAYVALRYVARSGWRVGGLAGVCLTLDTTGARPA